MNNYVVILCCLLFIPYESCVAIREYTKEDILRLREEVREMFTHAYDSYLRYAYPYDELRPLSCDGMDTWGSYSLTLVDALDTLVIMGNYTEFNRVVDVILQKKDFDADINVSVFETNIRIVGGLLSAHLLSYKTGMKLEPGWPCNGPLLRLAEDVAQRLIPAFDTTTGMPYGTINLRSGVPPGETSVTCTAGVGTFIVEFGTLSRLTGDPLYEEVAYNALKALYHHRSPIGLVGNHVDVMTGRWTAQDAGIGGGVDSYFEYLVKGAILLEKPELMSMFREAREVIDKYLKKDDWFVWATMLRGHVTLPVFQSLDSYWPGVLALIGEHDTALRIIHNYHSVWKQYGFTPEVYNLGTGEAAAAREAYPLRPELAESIMLLHRATRDPVLLQMGEDVLRSLQHSARAPCGYATHDTALRIIHNYHSVWKQYGFTPEVYNLGTGEAAAAREAYPLRPELAESIMLLHRATRDPVLLQMGEDVLRSLQHSARAPCGYATIKDVRDHRKEDRMESFFLAETTKYLYLLFDPDNFIHNPGVHGTVIDTPNGECIVDLGGYIFNTEAHPIDPAMLYCCHEARKGINISEINIMYKILEEEDNIKFMSMIDTSANKNISNETSQENTEVPLKLSVNTSEETNNDSNVDQDKVLIKTETKAGYVNIDGTEREKAKNDSLRELVMERISSYYNNTILNTDSKEYKDTVEEILAESNESDTNANTNVNIDDIIVQEKPPEMEKVEPPSSRKAKQAFKMLPEVIQEYLSKDWKEKSKCEPQHMLERMRKEKRYPDHPDVNKYELLLSPAPSFLERISLAGEFLNKNQLEM